MVAIIPWAPEPVMLIAGFERPMTLASMAPLQNNEAVFLSSSDTRTPPFFFNRYGP